MTIDSNFGASQNSEHHFPLWEIILVVVVLLAIVLFFIFRSGDVASDYEPQTDQGLESNDLNQTAPDPLSPEESREVLETLNRPVDTAPGN